MKTLYLALSIIAIACATPKAEDSKSMSQGEWQGRMREISVSFSKLLKLSASDGAFLNPQNTETIEEETKQLSVVAKEIHQGGKKLSFDNDPVLSSVSKDFSREMKLAHDEFKKGHKLYARSLIQNSMNYCISCHTRTNQGQYDTTFFLQADVQNLPVLDRANYFAAVRQFPKALDFYDQALTNKQFAQESPRQWSSGIKKSLAVAVRVNRDPSLSLELVSRVFDARSVPQSLVQAAQTWRASIKEWRDSRSDKPQSSKSEQLKEAKSLISKAQAVNYSLNNSDAGLIYYLRASTILHDILSTPKELNNISEALYYAGLAAEGLKEINLWTFDEIYYESCIRQKPHSAIAQKCFARFESLQLFSTRNIGDEMIVPTIEVRNKIEELKKLAM